MGAAAAAVVVAHVVIARHVPAVRGAVGVLFLRENRKIPGGGGGLT